jgi:hypothetical protein
MKRAIGEVNVGPLERQDLTATQPSIATEENHQVGVRVHGLRCLDEAFVLIEIVEIGVSRGDSQELDGTGSTVDDFPFDCDFQHHAQRCEDGVHGRRCFVLKAVLNPLYIFVGDRI